MGTIYEILKVILPAIVTGIFTFLITKYTYNKNRPLDKIEIAYNRIYYPLYRILSDKNIDNDIDRFIDQSKIYFIKYDKYIDISTKRLFQLLCECNKKTEKNSIYINLKNSIYNRNSYLRRRLGYLEPNLVQVYKYSTPSEKSTVRIIIEVFILYSLFIISGIFISFRLKAFYSSIACLIVVFLIIIIIEFLCFILRFLYYKIRK